MNSELLSARVPSSLVPIALEVCKVTGLLRPLIAKVDELTDGQWVTFGVGAVDAVLSLGVKTHLFLSLGDTSYVSSAPSSARAPLRTRPEYNPVFVHFQSPLVVLLKILNDTHTISAMHN